MIKIKKHLIFAIVCISVVVLGVQLFLMLNSKKSEDIKIITKSELMSLLNLDNLCCEVLSLKINEVNWPDTDNSDSTTFVIHLSAPSKYIKSDERFNVKHQNDNDAYEHVFNHYAFSTQQFDAIGSFFNEISIKRNREILYIPYEIWWGISYSSVDTYDVVVFGTIPQNIVVAQG